MQAIAPYRRRPIKRAWAGEQWSQAMLLALTVRNSTSCISNGAMAGMGPLEMTCISRFGNLRPDTSKTTSVMMFVCGLSGI